MASGIDESSLLESEAMWGGRQIASPALRHQPVLSRLSADRGRLPDVRANLAPIPPDGHCCLKTCIWKRRSERGPKAINQLRRLESVRMMSRGWVECDRLIAAGGTSGKLVIY